MLEDGIPFKIILQRKSTIYSVFILYLFSAVSTACTGIKQTKINLSLVIELLLFLCQGG